MMFDARVDVLESDNGGIYRRVAPGVEEGLRTPTTGGATFRDGMTFKIDGRVLEFDSGPVLVVPNDDELGYIIKDGDTFTLTDTSGHDATITFEFEDTSDNTDPPVASGNVAIPFDGLHGTAAQLQDALLLALGSVGDRLTVRATAIGSRITLENDAHLETSAGGTDGEFPMDGRFVEGDYGLRWGTIRVPLEETSTPAAIENALVAAINGASFGVTAQASEGGRVSLTNATSVDLLFAPALGPRPRWVSLNGNLAITEVRSVAYDSLNDVIFAGTQDNGMIEQTAGGSMNWTAALGWRKAGQPIYMAGDGLDQAVDASSNDITLRYSTWPDWRLSCASRASHRTPSFADGCLPSSRCCWARWSERCWCSRSPAGRR